MTNQVNQPDDVLLSIEALNVSLGGNPILHQIQLKSGAGALGIHGANGSGKSTLLRAIAGIYHLQQGSIQIAGHDLQNAPVKARQNIGYVPEHAELYPYLSCRELCETVSALRNAPLNAWQKQIGALGLAGSEDVRLGMLSAGQQRKVTMLVALCGEPSILLLDEPTKALDQQALTFLDTIIKKWKKMNKLVIITSHRQSYLEEHCTHFFQLEQGREKSPDFAH